MGRMLSDVLIDDYSKILTIAFTMVDNDADAQDLIQDLAEKIIRNDLPAANYEKPLAYFSKIMRNKRRDGIRAQTRAQLVPPQIIDTHKTVENVETVTQYHQLLEIFQQELLTLSPEMREAFMMVYFDGFPLEEVAKMMGIASNTLSQRFRRFRLKLGKRLRIESITMMIIATAFINIG